MSHSANFIIASGFVSVTVVLPLSYLIMKWQLGKRKSWTGFVFDDNLQPDDLRFSVLSGNLLIGKEEMPYPVYKNLAHLDSSFRKWLTQSLMHRLPASDHHGKVDAANITSFSRKIFSLSVNTLYITGFLLLILRNLGFISIHKAFILTLVFTAWLNLLLPASFFNSWITSHGGLTIGRWIFKMSIPWSDISALSIGFPKANWSGSRRSMFMIRFQYKEKTLEIHSRKLISLFPLYDAITTFRPELKMVSEMSSTQGLCT